MEIRHINGRIALARKDKPPAEIDATQYPATRRMAEKVATADGDAAYAERKWISEAPKRLD